MRRRDLAPALMLLTPAAWAQKNGGLAGAPWAAIEAGVGGRLGVAVLDGTTGAVSGTRLDERFPLCSTFKWLLGAAVLRRVDAGRERLDRRIAYGADALLENSPVTKRHVGRGMSVGALCEATITQSDNAAANLLLARLGGPAAVTDVARWLGDETTRLDRIEPEMNEAAPGDPRDTTTPRGIAMAMHGALLSDRLSPASRAQLARWLVATTTGRHRLRAGFPAHWRAGDKTGTGDRGSTNDVAIAWPPHRAPVVVAAYLTDSEAPFEKREAALAAVGRAAATALSSRA